MNRERLIHCEGSDVVWADYGWLRSAYASKNLSPPPTNSNIDQCLLDELSFLSEACFQHNDVLEPLDGSSRYTSVLRPPGFNRAAIFQTSFGLLDVKGIGVPPPEVPKLTHYGTGMLEFGIAVHELLTQRYIERYKSVHGIRSTKCLAIILLPVLARSIQLEKPPTRCALLVREAFPRPNVSPAVCSYLDALSEFCLDLEMRLRRISLTTTSPDTSLDVVMGPAGLKVSSCNGPASPAVHEYFEGCLQSYNGRPPRRFDIINIQYGIDPSTSEPCLVDFGGFWHGTLFDAPTLAAFQEDNQIYLRLRKPTDDGFVRKAKVKPDVAKMFKRVTRRLPYPCSQDQHYQMRARAVVIDIARLQDQISSADTYRKDIQSRLDALAHGRGH